MTRTASEIGAGLAPARASRAIGPGERIHVVGVAGAGASAAALLAAATGAIVSGCDPGGASPYTPALEAALMPLLWEHDPRHVEAPPRPDRLAVTKALTAIEPDHPELVAARRLGIPLEPWQQLIADAAVGRRLVAVAGTHGKSTTAGWLTHVLAAAGADPSAFVGALLPAALTGGVPSTARQGRGVPFVVEADEYADNFAPYRPSIAVLTNIDWDHPDVFANRTSVVDAFAAWLRPPGTAPQGAADAAALVANVADPGVGELLGRVAPWPGRVVRTAVSGTGTGGTGGTAGAGRAGGTGGVEIVATVLEAARDGTLVRIAGLAGGAVEVRLPSAGSHNVANALGAAGAAHVLGLDGGAIAAGLATFPGVGRRLERIGEAGGVSVYDDYAHHPTAIRATLAAVRQREPHRRVWIAHEPLTFHRTAALLDELATALGEADGVAIADIWAGRDPDRTIASAAALADAVKRHRPDLPVAATGNVVETADWLAAAVKPGDVVVAMGGGQSYRIPALLLARLGGAVTG